jgi:hypothetical protein
MCGGTPGDPPPSTQSEPRQDTPGQEVHQHQTSTAQSSGNYTTGACQHIDPSHIAPSPPASIFNFLASSQETTSQLPASSGEMFTSTESLARPLEETSYSNPDLSSPPDDLKRTSSTRSLARPLEELPLIMPYPSSQSETNLQPQQAQPPSPRASLYSAYWASSQRDIVQLLEDLRILREAGGSPTSASPPSPPPNSEDWATSISAFATPDLRPYEDSESQGAMSWILISQSRTIEDMRHFEETGEYPPSIPARSRRTSTQLPTCLETPVEETAEETAQPQTTGSPACTPVGTLSPSPISPARPLEERSIVDYIAVPNQTCTEEPTSGGEQKQAADVSTPRSMGSSWEDMSASPTSS